MKIVYLVFAVFALAGCMHAEEPQKKEQPVIKPKMVKPEVFEGYYRGMKEGPVHTMRYTGFEGVVDGVAILKVGKMNVLTNKFNVKYIGVKLADLDPELRVEIEKLDQ